MKILVHNDDNLKQTVFWFDYLRNIYPELMQDVIMIDLSHSEIIHDWAVEQHDFTYVYFEEEVLCGSAYNQVIEELEINDDILISDCYHIPLIGSYDKLAQEIYEKDEICAVGPVSNTFGWEQHISWPDAEAALQWSEGSLSRSVEEVMMLQSEVILFSNSIISGNDTFDPETKDIKNMVTEKCLREFLNHFRMFVCKDSGFWDTRGNEYVSITFPDTEMLQRRFDMHYLNVHGNAWIINLLAECEDLSDDIRVLEVGCDCGGNLFLVKKLFKDAHLYGTDICEGSLKFAAEFAEVMINNIEDRNLSFDKFDFDVIIFGDVLEHLRDPLGTLIYCKQLLKKGGRIVTSIPNLMNIKVMKYLLDGNFPYSDYGLLDRTHIHMFTYNEIIKMFVTDAGYKIEKMAMSGSTEEDEDKLINELLKLGNAEDYMYRAYQYQVVARL